jgi:hypothetical protein
MFLRKRELNLMIVLSPQSSIQKKNTLDSCTQDSGLRTHLIALTLTGFVNRSSVSGGSSLTD